MGVYEYKTQIRYNDINEENELSDKGLLTILAEAAGLHSESVGYGLNTMDKTNCAWMILSWKVEIYKRPRWNTNLTVRTWGRAFRRASTWRDYEVFDDSTGERIAKATSEWILMNAREKSIGRITEEMMQDYGIVEKNVFEEQFTGKLNEVENMKKMCEYKVVRRDIDINHHVNNIMYLEIVYSALPHDIKPNFNNIEIYYKKQVKLGNIVSCFYAKEGEEHIISIKSQDEKTLHAILKFSNIDFN